MRPQARNPESTTYTCRGVRKVGPNLSLGPCFSFKAWDLNILRFLDGRFKVLDFRVSGFGLSGI